MGFIKLNSNPLNKRTSDSHVRAVAEACNISWEQAYQELFSEALKQKDDCFSTNVVDAVLKNRGFTPGKVYVTKGSTRPKVSSFAEQNKDKVCVMRISGYYTACAYGNYVDIEDYGGSSIYKYWYKSIQS